jgi:RNA-directed DNA polymerase
VLVAKKIRDFPPALAFPVPGVTGGWQLGVELREKIEHSGFKINDKKTRMQFRGSRQVTTGLIVNEKVNIRQEYWRTVRQMCHTLFAMKIGRVVSSALVVLNVSSTASKFR